MATKDDIRAGEVLADLINDAMRRKGLSASDAAARALVLQLPALGARTINHYRNAKAGEPKRRKIADFARLFGESPAVWLNACGAGESPARSVYSSNDVLQMQRTLDEGDSVWIISCRAFGETQEPVIQKVVLDALNRGVTYCYFFPRDAGKGQSKHPFGSAASDSYRAFRSRQIVQYDFARSPQIAGFGVDPSLFPYFSKLHTIISYRRRDSEPIALLGAGTAFDRSKIDLREQLWHVLPSKEFRKLTTRLETARDAVADENLRDLRINPRVSQLNRTYAHYFESPESGPEADRLGAILRPADRSIPLIVQEIGKADPKESMDGRIHFLDVGCGSGTVTREILDRLQEQNRGNFHLTALDASPVRIEAARVTLKDAIPGSAPTFCSEPFDHAKLPAQEFGIITSIHSTYAMDDGVLGRFFDLLAPGGIACIWMHGRDGNVIAKMADAVDEVLHPGQRRNFAEDVIRIFQLIGLAPRSRFSVDPVVGFIPSLLDDEGVLNADGMEFFRFLSCGQRDPNDSALAAATAAAEAMLKPRGHQITDYLISFQRVE